MKALFSTLFLAMVLIFSTQAFAAKTTCIDEYYLDKCLHEASHDICNKKVYGDEDIIESYAWKCVAEDWLDREKDSSEFRGYSKEEKEEELFNECYNVCLEEVLPELVNDCAYLEIKYDKVDPAEYGCYKYISCEKEKLLDSNFDIELTGPAGAPFQNVEFKDEGINKSLYFKGNEESFVVLNNEDILDGLVDFTIMFWVKYDTDSINKPSKQAILSAANWAEDNEFTIYNLSDLTVYFKGEAKKIGQKLSLNDGKWHHIALTKHLSYIKVHFDGVHRGTITGLPKEPLNVKSIILGQEQDIDKKDQYAFKSVANMYSDKEFCVDGKQSFNGNIDELKIYNYDLSKDEIDEILGDESMKMLLQNLKK